MLNEFENRDTPFLGNQTVSSFQRLPHTLYNTQLTATK